LFKLGFGLSSNYLDPRCSARVFCLPFIKKNRQQPDSALFSSLINNADMGLKKNTGMAAAALLMLGALPAQAQQRKFIETANFDRSVKPGDDFFQYVNGTWIRNTVIPPTQNSAGSFYDLYNATKEKVNGLLVKASRANAPKGSIEQKVGDFYASGMDTVTIERLGYSPIKPVLQQISALTSTAQILQLDASLQRQQSAVIVPMYIGADEKNSAYNIAILLQGGLGLPDRDYYFKTDAETEAIRKAYTTYISRLFTLTGDDTATAARKAALVYGLEKQLAASHRTNVELRDPQSNYNKMALKDFAARTPHANFPAYFAALGIRPDSLNVSQPAYFYKVDSLLTTVPLDTWKAYMSAHIIRSAANALSSPFVNASFEYTRTLTGQKQIKPRWERMYQNTDGNLGELLGQLYVKAYFTEDAKKRMLQLISNLQAAFENRISRLDWMSDSTKLVAKGKLHTFLKKIGFPEKWRDYSKVTINRNTYYANLVACSKNEFAYQISKVGKPVDKTEWAMTPPTINAYYNPTFNEIVFPAGILQFPFFDPQADDAINYGGIGMVIGHEMTHGFDDQGAQYDQDGNLKTWWGKTDEDRFKVKSQQVIDQYNQFVVLDTLHLNGALTTGENMADIGGIAIAYDAFKMTPQGRSQEKIDGFTPDQRFFISLAQIWRTKMQDKSLRLQVITNPHSPAEFRVNGPLMNFTPFYTAFQVQPGDKMYKPEAERIKIW
jgi:putative endopeptidase